MPHQAEEAELRPEAGFACCKLRGQQAMKKLAVASLGLALWIGGNAQAQSPFFQPAPQPVVPVAAPAPMVPQFPTANVFPVRVHFGGALTKEGVVPLPVYLNQPAAPMRYVPPAAASVRQVSGPAAGKS